MPKPHHLAKLLLTAIWVCVASLQAETRFFVSTAGSLLEAEIIAVAADAVMLRKKDDGKEIRVPRNTLCKEDHAYIDAWAAAHPETATAAPAATAPTAAGTKKFSLTTLVRSKKSTRGFADGGYRSIDISYGYSIQNREVTRHIRDAKATILTFAKEASNDQGTHLYVTQKIEHELNLTPQAKMENATPDVRLSYYEGGAYRSGAKEYGYMLIITDSAGEIQRVDANPDTLSKYAKEALTLTAPSVVSREFRIINTSFSTYISVTTP
ncbi:MAG: hypothetical protein IPK32_07235 [Verrucomicrobiaceae bacterium]|nr:hypothetical protein [Verrucomicrobiaceae bacterium]